MVCLAATRAAAASDRLAVLVVVEGDPDLSDSLTEVAISNLALRRDRLLVGLREVRESLGDILGDAGIGGCVEQPACLARLGAATRAESALIGDVRRETDQYVVRLSLVNTRTAVREAEFERTVPADMKALIATIRDGVASSFEPKPGPPIAPGPPAQSDPSSRQAQLLLRPPGPGGAAASPPSLLLPRNDKPAPRPGWLTAAGFGAGGLAIVTLSAAIVIGSRVTGAPVGATRPEAERDLERREHNATIANSLFFASGVLAIAACAAFLWRWGHE